ncbi:MAG: phosphoesterase RecJ domain protein [Anaerocolumna sp.]|nr:phosphoesterase RecJ domain protein [Anaerocolumna sp.]
MTNLDKLARTITNNHVFIQTHNYPDQDALASSFGLQILLESKNIKSTICYSGQIDKYNTQKMVELLPMNILNNEEFSMKEEDEIILVDSQKGNRNVFTFPGRIIACIDHHPMQEVKDYGFFDIRSHVGACATIIGEYFLANHINVSKDTATALVYGIKMDTGNLSRKVTELDVEIFSLLYKLVDQDKLHRIESSSLRKEDLRAYQEAITNLKIYGRIGIAKIGNHYSEAILGSISDFLLTLAEIDITLIYSYRMGGLKFSVRSASPRIDAGKLIKNALINLGDGGGHATMAAGFIPSLQTELEINDMGALVEQRIIEFVTKNL